jgi:hypothetical protein
MIEQQLHHGGLLAETPTNPLFPRLADLILVFFPTPGIFVRSNISIPDEFKSDSATFYEESGEPFEEMYVFLPAVLQSQYDAGKTSSGIVYEKDVLRFEPDLIQALVDQNPEIIEHRSSGVYRHPSVL